MESGSRVGIKPKLYKPVLADKKHHFSLQKCFLHTRETFCTSLGYFLVFIEFYILICILIGRQKRIHLKSTPPAVLQPPQHAPRRRITPGLCPGSFKDKKKDATATSWLTLYTLTYQDTRLLSGYHLPFLASSKNAFTLTSQSQSPI